METARGDDDASWKTVGWPDPPVVGDAHTGRARRRGRTEYR